MGDPLRALRDGRGLLETPAPLFGSQGSVLGHSCTHCFMPLNTIRFADLAETAPRASLAKPNHPTDNTKPASSIALFSFLYVNRRRTRQSRAASRPPQRQKTGLDCNFLRLGIVQGSKTQICSVKPQVISFAIACFRFTEAKRSP